MTDRNGNLYALYRSAEFIPVTDRLRLFLRYDRPRFRKDYAGAIVTLFCGTLLVFQLCCSVRLTRRRSIEMSALHVFGQYRFLTDQFRLRSFWAFP